MKNKVPMVLNITDLRDWKIIEETSSGERYFARPKGFEGIHFMMRLKVAWKVFTGQLDAIKWNNPEQ